MRLAVLPLLAVVALAPVRPDPADRFQIQLGDQPADLSVEAEARELDLFETTRAEVQQLHDESAWVACYFSAGSWEPYRPDRRAFPQDVRGEPIQGFEDERWLDVRRLRVLLPIMERRLDLCQRKGFDGVDFDNVDAWTNDTGFPLTRADSLRYVRILAREALQRGLSPGLKNALGLIPDVVDRYGWAVNEQCVQYRECRHYRPFVEAGKAVFILEYRGTRATVCGREPPGTSVQLKRLRLDAYAVRCPYRPPP